MTSFTERMVREYAQRNNLEIDIRWDERKVYGKYDQVACEKLIGTLTVGAVESTVEMDKKDKETIEQKLFVLAWAEIRRNK